MSLEQRLTASEVANACGQYLARQRGLKGTFRVSVVPEVRGDELSGAYVTLERIEQRAPSPDYRIAEVKP